MAARLSVGITGDVGAGKSTVLGLIAERGAAVLDADRVVHGLLADDATTTAAVRDRFPAAARPDGTIDRGVLADAVFADADALADLERLLHPAVHRRVVSWLAAASADVAAVEAVKLVESGLGESMGEVWLVACDRAVRRERLAARGWSSDEVERRMAAGPPLGPRLAVADVVIDNSGSPGATRTQVKRAWADALAKVGGGGPS